MERGIQQRCVFSVGFFNLYSELISRELDVLPSGHKNIRYNAASVIIEDTEKKTTRTPTEGSEEKPAETTKHKSQEDNAKSNDCINLNIWEVF